MELLLDLSQPIAADWRNDEPDLAVDDASVEARYSSGEVRIVTEQSRTQLAELPAILASDRYEMQPDFQRRHRWDRTRQSRLIESFIMNVPVPPIFLYEYEYSRYEVMDGLQRLTAIKEFYAGEFPLEGLEHWPELNGRTYGTLPPQLQQAIDRRHISSVVLLRETAKDAESAQNLKQLVFERINSGGIELTDQESRNALSSGPLNDILPRLARTPSFCRLWSLPEPEGGADDTQDPGAELLADPRFQRMEDVEMVLRFFAQPYRHQEGAPRKLKKLLDTFWRVANDMSSVEEIETVGKVFVESCDLAEELLGENAFYLRRERGGKMEWIKKPTLLAYDTVMAALSDLLDRRDEMIENREQIQGAIMSLYDENPNAFDGRRTDPQDLKKREDLVRDSILHVLGSGG